MGDHGKGQVDAGSNADADHERRAALKRLGAYAAYTPPAVLTLLASRKATAASFGGIGGGGGEPEP